MSGGRDANGAIRVTITGAAGFLGTLLARHLLSHPISVAGSAPSEVSELTLIDLVRPPEDVASDRRVRVKTGDLAESLEPSDDADAVFHLAGVVSGAAEADFDLGMRANIDALRALLEWCRGRTVPPVLVFSSSLAVYGADPAASPLGVVDDNTLPRPQSSYGTQKFIGEQLVADYTRKEFVRGRSARLMTVVVRPGRPNAAASSFLSSIIREPLRGERAVCPVAPTTLVAISSPTRTRDGLLRAAAVDDRTWGSRTAMNLPALTTTPREMAQALDHVSGERLSDLIDWLDVRSVGDIVESWPARFVTQRATTLGLQPPDSIEEVVRAYVETRGGRET